MANSLHLDLNTVVAPSGFVSTADLDGDAVVLVRSTGQYFSLNELGSFIWHQLETPQSVTALAQCIQAEYDVDEATCVRDLMALLAEMIEADMVVIPDAANQPAAMARVDG